MIKLPIDNDRDCQTVLCILYPDVFNIDYAIPEARELYYSLTTKQIEMIKEDIAHYGH